MIQPIPIIKEPHAVLHKIAYDVLISEIGSKKIQNLIAAMKETLRHTSDGVGLAAPQVGESLRIFIVSEEAEEIDRTEIKQRISDNTHATGNEKPYTIRPWRYYVFINPVVKNRSRTKQDGHEGCLSVPGLFGNVIRKEKISVLAFDEHGKKFIRGESRFFARVIQHELDHLDGILFIDKARNVMALR